MPDIYAVAGKVAGVLSLAAYVPYIISILRGQTLPNRVSWWIWTVAGFMLGASYYASGANHTIWVPVAYVVGPFIVAVLSIKYGQGGWNRFDQTCLVGAVISITLWWLLGSALVGLVVMLVFDFMGVLPTARKSYYEPESEDRLAWAISLAGSTANLFAVEIWVFAIAVYPVYMVVTNGMLTALVFFRPRRRNHGHEKLS